MYYGYARDDSESGISPGYKVPFFGSVTKIVEVLGSGAFGSVGTIKADPSLVVKVVKVETNGQKDEIHLEEEMLSLMSDLPTVPKIVDLIFRDKKSSSKKEAFMYIERCESDFSKEIRKSKYHSFDTIIGWLYDITFSLAAFHERGYTHNDVKPGNLMIGMDGTAKLGDYGLSNPQRNGEKFTGFKGTFQYSSPEKIRSWLKRHFVQLLKEDKDDSDVQYELRAFKREIKYWKGLSINWEGFTSDVWGLASVFYSLCTKDVLGVRIKKNRIDTRVEMGWVSQNDIYYQIDRNMTFSKCYRLIPLFKRMLLFDPLQRPTMKQILKELEIIKPNIAANRPWSTCNSECLIDEQGIRKIEHTKNDNDNENASNFVSFLFCWPGNSIDPNDPTTNPYIPWYEKNFFRLKGFEVEPLSENDSDTVENNNDIKYENIVNKVDNNHIINKEEANNDYKYDKQNNKVNNNQDIVTPPLPDKIIYEKKGDVVDDNNKRINNTNQENNKDKINDALNINDIYNNINHIPDIVNNIDDVKVPSQHVIDKQSLDPPYNITSNITSIDDMNKVFVNNNDIIVDNTIINNIINNTIENKHKDLNDIYDENSINALEFINNKTNQILDFISENSGIDYNENENKSLHNIEKKSNFRTPKKKADSFINNILSEIQSYSEKNKHSIPHGFFGALKDTIFPLLNSIKSSISEMPIISPNSKSEI